MKTKAYIIIFFLIIFIDLGCIYCYFNESKDIGTLIVGLFVTIGLLGLLYLEITGINKDRKEIKEQQKWCEHNKNMAGVYTRCYLCNPEE